MKNVKSYLVMLIFLLGLATELSAQKRIYVRPVETDDVLVNPGIGFMTFQRFNGDELNEGSRLDRRLSDRVPGF